QSDQDGFFGSGTPPLAGGVDRGPVAGAQRAVCRIDFSMSPGAACILPGRLPLPCPPSRGGPCTMSSSTPAISWNPPERQAAFEAWLRGLAGHGVDPATVRPASADASF